MSSIQVNFGKPLSNQKIVQDIAAAYPPPLQRVLYVFTDLYDKGEYAIAYREMIKVFVSVFKYTGLIIVCDYLRLTKDLQDEEQCRQILSIDKFLYTNLKGMSLGHWQWCLREITRWAKETDHQLFMPELQSLYWKNNGKATRIAQWIDNKMIPLRNDFVHSDIWVDNDEANELIKEYAPQLLEYLQETSFLSRYQLSEKAPAFFQLTDQDGNILLLQYLIIMSKKPEWKQEEVLFFETMKGKTVKYLLGNLYNFEEAFKDAITELQVPLKKRISFSEKEVTEEETTTVTLDETRELLDNAYQQLQCIKGDINALPDKAESEKDIFNSIDTSLLSADSAITHAKTKLVQAQKQIYSPQSDEWEHYRNAAKLVIYQEMLNAQGSLLAQQSFDSLYIERDEAYQQYQKFVTASGANFSLLLAESGAGKTVFCTKRVREWLQSIKQESKGSEDIVFFFPSGIFPADHLEEFFMQQLGNPRQILSQALQVLDKSDKPADAQLIVIIDGLNEADDPSALLEFISTELLKHPYPCLKIYVSCRIIMWDQLSKDLHIPSEQVFAPGGSVDTASEIPFVRLGAFSPEDVEKAYEKYAVNRFIKTKFSKLPPFVKELCSDPFLLGLITEAYKGTVKEKKEILFSSLDDIFTRYLYHTNPRKLTPVQQDKRIPADVMIVRRLLKIMWQEKKDFVVEEQLQADPELEAMIYEPAPLETSNGLIKCTDRICRWQWHPVPGEDIPFACPACGNHTLDWNHNEDEDFISCTAEGCDWRWTPDASRNPSFNCPNGHSLEWSHSDTRTPYQRLLDEGVLVEILRNDGAFIVKFRYDRIFEYLMAKEMLREPDFDKIVKWCDELFNQKGISPIFLEAVATAISFSDAPFPLINQLITLKDSPVLHVVSSALKKIAASSESGLETTQIFLCKEAKKGNASILNHVVIPVTYSLRKSSIPVLSCLARNSRETIRKEFSNLLYRIVAANIEDGLYIIREFLQTISVTNIVRKMTLFRMLLDLSLKLASLLDPARAVELVSIWADLIKRLTLSGTDNLLLKGLRRIAEGILTGVGSTVVFSQMKKMIVGKTTLYNVLFTPSQFKKGMYEISEFFLPQPERLYEIESTLSWFLNVPIDSDNAEGLEMLGLMPILVFNVQLRYDVKAVLPILERLYQGGNLYARWAICSAVNYSLQESYFSHGNKKPLEKDPEVTAVFRAFIERFYTEERDGIVRDSLTEGDYYFPLGIPVEFSFAVDKNSEMVRDILNKSYRDNDVKLFCRLLFDMMCFSLDTFCVQRRFWEKAMDLIPEIVKQVFPLEKNADRPFPEDRDQVQGAFYEALAIFQYAYPNETEKMLSGLCDDYKKSDNTDSYNFVTSLNTKSKEALNGKFHYLRTNCIGFDKKNRPIEIESISTFIERFLYGWVFADFISAIFGRYPGFRDVAKFWIQEPLAKEYEKNPRRLTKKFFRAIFDFLDT